MKRSLFILLLITVISFNTRGQIVFPQDFKLDPKLLAGMTIAKIPEEFHSEGITDNPVVSQDRSVIRMISDLDNDYIVQIYFEAYQGIESIYDDAGVIVSEFVSKEALLDCLPDLRSQNNLAYLTKNNYLIQLWSDSSKERKAQIDNMVSYYQDKLQAEVYKIGVDDYQYESETASEELDSLEISIVEVEENEPREIEISIE